MADSEDKKPGVPAWQLEASQKPASTPEIAAEPSASGPESHAEPNRATILEQAKKFLEEDEVRNASTDKKIAFLESKGLESQEIQELLGVKRNAEATASTSRSESAQTHTVSPPMPTRPLQPVRDAPPIITYPEFLTKSTSPPPLITRQRLLTTIYLFGGLSAILYGTNNYLVQPMVESLTTSRLSLAETAQANLQKLISKLEEAVSEIPTATGPGVYRDEGEDSDEDPTEMFHRDIGVQTSLPNTPSASRPETPRPTALNSQTEVLKGMQVRFTELIEDTTSEGQDQSDLSATINILKDYLDGLAYVTPSYTYGVGGYNTNSADKDDEISKVKQQIRGVKGVLLSARSFPAARTVR
ncbi:hypothetical protein BP5796_06505 [Coleophoma crateriformis]|uniref:Peroxisomal membrane protein PEX14 n=1 Tax=Coleophoma crateriformis TaxID=565419 RepID=A0A3D8RP62_9HELO|nr:hypothetical protein BP5796_06505 [Coleophoma crateriformis]